MKTTTTNATTTTIVTSTYRDAYNNGPASHLYSLTHGGYIKLRLAFGRALITTENGTEMNARPEDELTWAK